MSETLTVRQFCQAVGSAVEAAFDGEVWVEGAISGLNRSANGHVYFDLVEPSDGPGSGSSAVVPVVLFASDKHRVNAILRKSGSVRMHDGVEIRIRGRVAYYPRGGRVQVVMSLIDPSYTIGQMAAARQALLDKLAAEDLLGANGRVPFPALPLRVGLVTSAQSAAHADFTHELASSGFAFEVRLFDARVQGVDAVPSLVEGLVRADQDDLDVVVVIRGGGARTELTAFDHEQVARAIAACRHPVVVGVGHEIDRSVADEVANRSAKTPTASAAVLVDAVRDFESKVEHAASRLAGLATNRLGAASGSLALRGSRLAQVAGRATDRHLNQVDAAAGQLRYRATQVLDRFEAAVDRTELRLQAHDPAPLLGRGWSITHTADGDLVRSADQVGTGTGLVTTTATGTITSTVDGIGAGSEETTTDD